MSNNIDVFVLRRLENFSFPFPALITQLERNDEAYKIIRNYDRSINIELPSTDILGRIAMNGTYNISALFCGGSSSGFAISNILQPVFAQSSGKLVATCKCSGGKDVRRLYVDNGKIQWVDIDY